MGKMIEDVALRFTVDADRFIGDLEEAIAELKSFRRPGYTVNMYSEQHCEHGYTYFTVQYCRPETEQEVKDRKAKDRALANAARKDAQIRQQEQEQKELEIYLRVKAKLDSEKPIGTQDVDA